jgi:hypothetical protein
MHEWLFIVELTSGVPLVKSEDGRRSRIDYLLLRVDFGQRGDCYP